MNLLLGIDIESANAETDPGKNRVLELGVVLWDFGRKRPLEVANFLIRPYNEVPIGKEAFAKHGITDEDLWMLGLPAEPVLKRVARLKDMADGLVTHNGTVFDRPVLASFQREAGCATFAGSEWIDTIPDVPYPKDIATRNLVHLGAEHGFANPFRHRAVFDVLSMFTVMSHYTMEEILEFRASPVLFVVADVQYHNNQLAKDFSFRWDPDRKIWHKKVRQCVFDQEKDGYKFRYKLLPMEPVPEPEEDLVQSEPASNQGAPRELDLR